MPSPFPGMDPFLEAAEFFPSLHAKLIIYLEEALQPLLPEPYFAQTGERTWIEVAQRYIEPDLNVATPRGRTTHFANCPAPIQLVWMERPMVC